MVGLIEVVRCGGGGGGGGRFVAGGLFGGGYNSPLFYFSHSSLRRRYETKTTGYSRSNCLLQKILRQVKLKIFDRYTGCPITFCLGVTGTMRGSNTMF